MSYISALEQALDIEAEKNFLQMQLGDVPMTSADTSRLEEWLGFKPNTPVKEGIEKFVSWYKSFYSID